MKKIFTLAIAAALAIMMIGSGGDGKGSHQIMRVSSARAASLEMPPADFIPAHSDPQIIKRSQPVYPEEALRAGLEGEVWVKVLVNTEGKPEQVVILKSDSEIFNKASIDAAKQFLFSPAYIGDKPSSVWVTVPFKYKLADKKGPESKETTK